MRGAMAARILPYWARIPAIMMRDVSLYLVVEAGQTAPDRVGSVLAERDVPSMLIVPAGEDALTAAVALPLVELGQAHGTAVLIGDDARLARTLKADGVHLDMTKDIVAQYREAREIVGGGAIVGANAGKSRHDAMMLGEIGVDYVGFGAPPQLRDRPAGEQRRRDMISWWSELFEIPCVAFDVDTTNGAADVVGAGADFVTCRIDAGMSVADARDRVVSFARALAGERSEVSL